MANRKELIEKLNLQVRDNGNTNVLLVHAIAQHIGLSAAEFECCSLIQEHGPFTAGELAKRCHITTGGMTGMLDRLERAGFVKRTPDLNDRRRVLVSAVHNQQAINQVIALYGPMQAAFDKILDNYSDKDIAFIVDFIDRINVMFHDSLDTLPARHAAHK